MSSTGSGECSDQIPTRGRGMTAYQKEKSKASATHRPQGQQREVGAKGMKNKLKKIDLITEGLLWAWSECEKRSLG